MNNYDLTVSVFVFSQVELMLILPVLYYKFTSDCDDGAAAFASQPAISTALFPNPHEDLTLLDYTFLSQCYFKTRSKSLGLAN